MNQKYGTVAAVLLTLVFSLGPAALYADTVHVVAKGETVYSIARLYGVSQDELMRANGIGDPQRLTAGTRLKVPGAASGAPALGGGGPGTGFAEYRVIRGDTLYGIARQNGITLQSLLAANGLTLRSVLKEGDRIKVPRSPAQAAPESAAMPAALPAEKPGSPAPAADPRSTVRGAVDPLVRWPVAAREVIYMTGKLSGVVLVGERSEPVRSLTQGTVVSAGPYRGFGRVAIVQVAGGYLYVYGGCETLSVKEGDRVSAGTELGRLGLDAVSEKPQLFFMVYRSNTPVDPAKAPRA
jgi:murein DD-endopeptidase MepM/ murein hydrolase activator NlpD